MQRAGLIRATVVLGVLALFALTIGRVLAVIALISIIGIPIAFLLAVIPPLFLIFLLALGFTLVLERIGIPSIPVAFALAIGTMLALPVAVNRVTERDVASFVAGDRADPVEPWRGGTLAIFVPPRHNEECGDFCQRGLASGAVKRFIIARSAKTWPEADLAARGMAYRLEPRGQCDAVKLHDGLREIPVERKAAPAAPVLRLAIARGNCLVAESAPVSEADSILMHAKLRDDGLLRGRLNPFVAPKAATRLSFFVKGNNGFAEVWRQTSVRYMTLYPVLIPSFVPFAGVEADVGFWRQLKTAGAPGESPDIDQFLAHTLGMRLDLPKAEFAVGQEAAIDDALRQPVALTATNQALVEDVFKSLERGSDPADAETVQRALVLLKDPRVAIPARVSNLVHRTLRAADGVRDAVADALFDRLDAEVRAIPAGQAEVEARERSLHYLAAAVGAIPERDFARRWARLRVIGEKIEVASIFADQIRRARLVGNAAGQDMLALIDLQHATPLTLHTQDKRRGVLHAALSGLCGMGREASARLPEIEARLRSGVIATQYPNDWSAVANTLAALGGDANLLRELVPPNKIKAHLVRDFEDTIAGAGRTARCGFNS